MELVVERGNVIVGLKRLKKNKGQSWHRRDDGGRVPKYLVTHWETLRAHLLAGSYQPSAVRRQGDSEGRRWVRELGIPTVVDRFVQQAILQVLQPPFDAGFSSTATASDLVGMRTTQCAAQRYMQEGRRWVVDVDLEKFSTALFRRSRTP